MEDVKHASYLIRGHCSDTQLQCTPEDAAAIGLELEPYLQLTRAIPRTAVQTWNVSIAPHLGRGKAYETAPLGEPRAKFELDANERIVTCLEPAHGAWPVQNAVRLTRALHKLCAAGQGEVFMHGGLIVIDGVGVMICGPSRSGKTTLVASLATRGAAFIANDDVSLRLIPDGSLRGYGWPRSISVRMDSWKAVSASWAYELQTLCHPANASLRILRETGQEPHGTALLYPREFARIFGTSLLTTAKVDVVLFPSFSDDLAQPKIRPLTPLEGMQRLRACARSEVVLYESFLRACFPPGDQKLTSDALDATGRLPCFELVRSMESTQATADCIEELVGKCKRIA